MNYVKIRKVKKLLPVIGGLALLVVVGAYYLLGVGGKQEKPQTAAPKQMIVALNEYSESGQSGTATLKEEDGKLVVDIDVSGYETQDPQPAHIHTGGCPRIGPVIFGLTDVVSGKSTTQLETTFDDLLASNEKLNVNVHESYDNFSTYTACGDIK